ncbi:hypothetical protein FRB99_003590 [Tulasnella sp. 403]|nr:hypothetical protein FRB99_003590 [Tulasnella sp. 403]
MTTVNVGLSKHPPEAENWDDDFVFQTPTDETRPSDASVRRRSAATHGESINWDDDDDGPAIQQLPIRNVKTPQPDEVDWGDSDDDADRVPRLAHHTHATPDPSPGKWTTDGEDDEAARYDMDKTVTIKNRSTLANGSSAGPRSAMSSSASLPSDSQNHVHIPHHTRYSPTPYSPTSPTLSSAFSMGASSTAHLALRTTASKTSSLVTPPIAYQPPPRPRRRLRKKSRPPQVDVADVFEMVDSRGFLNELGESDNETTTAARPSARPTSLLPSPPLPLRSRSGPSPSPSHLTEAVSPPPSVPSSPSGRAQLLYRIGSMKNWSRRKGRHSSQSDMSVVGSLTADAAPSLTSREATPAESIVSPEHSAPTSPTPWMLRARSQSPTPEASDVSRRGSISRRSQTSVGKKHGISKVLGLVHSPSAQQTDDTSRRPTSFVQQPTRPPISKRKFTMARSTSNPLFQPPVKFPPAPGSVLGLKNLSVQNVHKRNKSLGAESASSLALHGIPPLPPLPSSDSLPPTPRLSNPPDKVSDEPPLLPPIELLPPSPPRLFPSASQPASTMGSSFLHLSDFSSTSSPTRSPGATTSLGRANGTTIVGKNGPSHLRRNSLGDLKIPARISKAQVGLKNNLTMVREFANNVEQLKDLQNMYKTLVLSIQLALEEGGPGQAEQLGSGHGVRPPGAGPPQILNKDISRLHTTEALKKLDEHYSLWWECADLLIDLGSGTVGGMIPEANATGGDERNTEHAPKSNPSASTTALGKARERAVTLGGETTSYSSAATAAKVSLSSSQGSLPNGHPHWRASTGRQDLSQRQLVLLKEMLNTPDPSTLTLPDVSKTSKPTTPSLDPSLQLDSFLPDMVDESHPYRQSYRPHHSAASALTLLESSASSSAPSRSRGGMPSTSDFTHNMPMSPPKGESKLRRASRVGLTGLRDMLRSLKKAAMQQSQGTSTDKPDGSQTSSLDSRVPVDGLPPVPPLPPLPHPPIPLQTGRRRSKTSTGAHTVAAAELVAPQSPEPVPPLPEEHPRPFSSQATRKSPRRPSLASLFRIGNGHKTDRKKSGRSSLGKTPSIGVGDTSTTTEEDYSDWDRIDSASDLDISMRGPSAAGTVDSNHDYTVNQRTVKGRRILVPKQAHDASAPSSPGYNTVPPPSESSLSLHGSPHGSPLHQPTRLPHAITEEAGQTPLAKKSSGNHPRRPVSRSRNRQATNSSLPPMPFDTLLAGGPVTPQPDPKSTSQPIPLPPVPSAPPPNAPTPERLALTPENIRPLLEYSKEIAARLNECVTELRYLNTTYNTIPTDM